MFQTRCVRGEWGKLTSSCFKAGDIDGPLNCGCDAATTTQLYGRYVAVRLDTSTSTPTPTPTHQLPHPHLTPTHLTPTHQHQRTCIDITACPTTRTAPPLRSLTNGSLTVNTWSAGIAESRTLRRPSTAGVCWGFGVPHREERWG